MAKRTWTYQEITDATEARIKHMMEVADSRRRTQKPEAAAMIENYAWGMYTLWEALTSGAQTTGDAKRLEALTEVRHG